MKQQDGHVPMDSRRRYHPHKETLTRLVLFQQLIIDMDSASVSTHSGSAAANQYRYYADE